MLKQRADSIVLCPVGSGPGCRPETVPRPARLPVLDGVGEAGVRGLRHEGDEEGGHQRDPPEHGQRHRVSVHRQVCYEGRDLASYEVRRGK